MCGECLGKLFVQAINDPGLMPPSCCKLEMDLNVAELVLSSVDCERFQKARLELLTPVDKKMYCTSETCSEFLLLDLVDTSETGGFFSCPACRKNLCARCRKTGHWGLTCEEQAELEVDAADGMLLRLANERQWKKCSNCSSTIELKKGCNHITCRCKFEFCYVCGTEWTGKTCSKGCQLFDEDMLLDGARRNVVARLGPNVDQVRMGREVDRQADRMRRHVDCVDQWRNRRADGTNCTGCGWEPDVYINGCCNCDVQVCKTCKMHRYGYGR
jgi:hypothetical protein